MVRSLLAGLVVVVLALPGAPQRAAASTVEDEQGVVDRLLVVKSERRLYLIKDSHVVGSYHVALGRNPSGHKVFEGDGRTPEGIYMLDARNNGSRFYRSIRISYPSADDLAEARKYGGRPGGLVMLHGQPADPTISYTEALGYDWTEGCIALSNAEMDEVWARTAPGTVIEIIP